MMIRAYRPPKAHGRVVYLEPMRTNLSALALLLTFGLPEMAPAGTVLFSSLEASGTVYDAQHGYGVTGSAANQGSSGGAGKKDTFNHDYLDSRRTDGKDAGNGKKEGQCCETPRPRRAVQGQAGSEGLSCQENRHGAPRSVESSLRTDGERVYRSQQSSKT